MPRQPRRLSASGVYHIMWRGIDKMQLYCDDADCIHFLSILDFVQNENYIVLAYCLMGNHVHLLIKTARDTTAPMESTMKKLGMRYAAHYNRRYQRIGPVYQGRYKSQPVESTSYFLRVLRYIHANPVSSRYRPSDERLPLEQLLRLFFLPQAPVPGGHQLCAALAGYGMAAPVAHPTGTECQRHAGYRHTAPD